MRKFIVKPFLPNCNFFIRSDSRVKKNPLLRLKWTSLHELVLKMLKQKDNERPTCSEVLSQFYLWDIRICEAKQDNNYNKNIIHLKQYSKKFFNDYFEEKIKCNESFYNYG